MCHNVDLFVGIELIDGDDLADFMSRITQILDTAGAPYMLAGSIASGWKAEFIVKKSRPFSKREFGRRIRTTFLGIVGVNGEG